MLEKVFLNDLLHLLSESHEYRPLTDLVDD